MVQINTKYNQASGGDPSGQLAHASRDQQQYQRGGGSGAPSKYIHPRGAPDASLIFGPTSK